MSDFEKKFAFQISRLGSFYSVKTTYFAILFFFETQYFEAKFTQIVRFWIEKENNAWEFELKLCVASDFDMKFNNAMEYFREVILQKKLLSKYHVLVLFTPWKWHTLHFLFFIKKAWFWTKIFTTCPILNWEKYNAS